MHTRRRNIQGLRAIAIGAVVMEHAFGQPHGGFLGVDVFFVVSGFLITGSLLHGIDRSGRVDLLEFWKRRARRLAPAFLTVAATTAVVFLVAFPSADPISIAAPLGAALVSMSNWWFIREGTDYFVANGPESPFLHTWSLSVEEQFYVLWPLLIVGTLWLLRPRRGRSRVDGRVRLGLTVVLAVVAAASIVVAALLGTGDAAYFSTATRAWELAAGALVAVAAARTTPPSSQVGLPMTVLGLLLIVGSIIVVDADAGVPFPGALPAVVGTVLVLVGGRAPSGGTVVLENPLSDWLGAVSYSLYLWHFPVLVFVEAVVPGGVWLVLPVSAVLAHLSTRFVEQPFLGRVPLRSWSWWTRRASLSGGALVLCTALALVSSAAVPQERVAATAPAVASSIPAVRDAQLHIVTALRATTWPAALDAERPGPVPAGAPRECGRIGTDRSEVSCTFGDPAATKTAVLVGDSIAGAWSEALVTWLHTEHPDWRVVVLARNGCPFITADVQPGVPCAALQQHVVDRVAQLRPDAVIVGTRFDGIPLERADGTGPLTAAEFERSSAAMIDRIVRLTPVVVQLAAPPAGADPTRCHVRFGSPQACVRAVSADWRARMASTERVAAEHGVRLVDTSPIVAVGGRTPATNRGALLRIDAVHLTPAASAASGPALGALIDAEGGLAG